MHNSHLLKYWSESHDFTRINDKGEEEQLLWGIIKQTNRKCCVVSAVSSARIPTENTAYVRACKQCGTTKTETFVPMEELWKPQLYTADNSEQASLSPGFYYGCSQILKHGVRLGMAAHAFTPSIQR